MKASIPRIFILCSLLLVLLLPGIRAGAQPPQDTFAPEVKNYQGATVTATPDSSSLSGQPGTSLTFRVALTSPTPINDSFSVEIANSNYWNVNASANPVIMENENAASVEIVVDIPGGVKDGEITDIVVKFTGASGTTVNPSPLPLRASAYTVQPTTPAQAVRPLVVVGSYYLDKDTIRPGDSFNLYVNVKNQGVQDAMNLMFAFTGEGFLPQETGGVVAVDAIGAGGSRDINQRFLVDSTLWGHDTGTISVKVTYNNPSGDPFTETFNLTLAVRGTLAGSAATATPTPTVTPTTVPRPQLVVSGYHANADPLQPGSVFSLDIEVANLGNNDAKAVTLVLGGGGSNTEPNAAGTPQPGGVSGGSSDLSIFAPIGSSNLIYLGDIPIGGKAKSTQQLIVNVTANPGAYAMKLSFVYNDSRGTRIVDDQIITMLVYSLPQVEVNFYRDPGPIFSMQPNTIPVQVVNLGRKSAVLGNMTVTAENADLMNNTMLVGTLDMGGYFPLDVMLIPRQPGPLTLNVKINYTDDFNQARTISQTIEIEVQEGAPQGDPGMMDPNMNPGGMDPGMNPGMPGTDGGMPVDGMPVVEETFWDKALRFIKGFFGLDSAIPQPAGPEMPMPGDMPPDGKPMPAPAGGGGGGKG